MRIGYSFWGFLGDYKIEDGKEVSAPDGNATYGWSIVWEAKRRGHIVMPMQKDRDYCGTAAYNLDNFASFSQNKRGNAYAHLITADNTFNSCHGFPELDVLLLEWRFPVPTRNTPDMRGKPGYQPDLDRQEALLQHYSKTKTKIIIWDLDHKLTLKDELQWAPHAILETSVCPRKLALERTKVEFPIVTDDLLQFPTLPADPKRKLVYIGSRYERDDVIEQYIRPVSDMYPGEVEFWGNWTREPYLSECKAMWPDISYNGRITVRDFREVYGTAVACPLLGKRTYLQTGFVTPRPWEAIMFGTLPIGLEEHLGIKDYTPFRAKNGVEMAAIAENLSRWDLEDRDGARKVIAEMLSRMDVKHFIDVIESVANVR